MTRDRIRVPACEGHEDAFSLTAAQKRELVLLIAQEGPEAIDRYIRERVAAGDSLLAERVRRLKQELLRRAQELRERLASGFGAKQDEVEAAYAAAYAELESRRRETEARLSRVDEGTALEEALRGSALVNLVLSAPPPEAKPPWRVRLRRLLRRVLAFLLAPLRWLLSLLFGRKGAAPAGKTIRYGVPVPGRLGVEMDSRLGSAVAADPRLRRRVRDHLRAAPPRERVKRAWERLLGREDYESIARRAMAEMLEREAEEKRKGLAERKRGVADELSRVLEEEEKLREKREDAFRKLEEEREREARRIEEQLASLPERELKDEILSELQATGLLREKGGRFLPTLQFMDAFATAVYEEEARGLASSRTGASGGYAEGEGVFQRGPMRYHLEVTHMDIPATLLRARSRHPHVRHLTDDDVLVYREEREALQHVVLIFDRSGSMEENDRLGAAKRATLALHHAVKSENPRNRVDVVLMDTSVKRADLVDVWEAEPRGFTNTGAALRVAADVLRAQRSDKGIVYLITDGLPEAYTVDGEDVAGHPEKALKYALEQARALKRVPGTVSLVVLLLEPEDEHHVKAAERLAKEVGGRVMKTDPKRLAQELVRSYQAPLAPTA